MNNLTNRLRDWGWAAFKRSPFLSAQPRFLRFSLQKILVINQFLVPCLFLKYLDKVNFRKIGKYLLNSIVIVVSHCCGRWDHFNEQLIWNYHQLITIMSPHQLLSAAHALCDTHRACALQLYGQWSWGQSEQDKARQ